MTTVQAMDVLDSMAEAGCLFLLITGGEPLLRPDFAAIYQHARQRGMIITLFTNGTLLTPQIADLLADMPPFSMEITLYGASAETYERVTGVAGSYARCRRGIDLALERGLKLGLKAVLMTLNQHELPQMRALAEQFGCKFRYDGTLWPRLDGGRQPFCYRLSVGELLALDRADPQRCQEWVRVAGKFSGQAARSEYVYGCGAGLESFHIDSAGRMCVCTMARRPSWDVLEGSFQEAWERLGDLRRVKRRLDTPCRTCTLGALCMQCPGWSQAMYGDDETPVDYVCELGRQRAVLVQLAAVGDNPGESESK